jgi:hypothetical protein
MRKVYDVSGCPSHKGTLAGSAALFDIKYIYHRPPSLLRLNPTHPLRPAAALEKGYLYIQMLAAAPFINLFF